MIERGDWQVSDIARDAFDLEGKVVGTIGAGRIGYRVLQRLVPFDCKELIYYDYAPLPAAAASAVKARRVEDLKVRKTQRKIHPRLLTLCRSGICRSGNPFGIYHHYRN